MIKSKFAILLFGLAGSGKGTQGRLICDNFNLLDVSAGDLLRSKIASGNIGLEAVKAIAAGHLIPANEVVHTVFDKISNSNLEGFTGFLLDGFPRNLEQDDLFRNKLEGDDAIDLAIWLDVEEKELFSRLSSRLYCSKCSKMYYSDGDSSESTKKICKFCGNTEFVCRNDDKKLSSIQKRFEIFRLETFKVIERYRKDGVLAIFNGLGDIKDIAKKIEAVVRDVVKK